MLSFLTDPLQYEFMRLAFGQLVLLSLLFGLIGAVVYLRNNAFLVEALSHGIFPGIVLAFFFKINLLWGAFLSSIVSALLITRLSSNPKVNGSNATSIIFTGAIALGVVLLANLPNGNANLSNFLIGQILGISLLDLVYTAGALILSAGIILPNFKKLLIIFTDKEFAQSKGINVQLWEVILNLLTAMAIVVGAQAAGALLVVAFAVIAPTAARLLAKSPNQLLMYSLGYSLLFSLIGLYVSYYLNVSTGSAIVLTQIVGLLAIAVTQKLRNII